MALMLVIGWRHRDHRVLLAFLLGLTISASLAGQSPQRAAPVALSLLANKLANSDFESASADTPVPQWLSIFSVSNTTPVAVTTAIPHGLTSGQSVVVKEVQGTTGANGFWTITYLDAKSFWLERSEGNGEYAGGGSVFPTAGQPPPPGQPDRTGAYAWTPWFSVPASIEPHEFFLSDGRRETGEVGSKPPVPGTAFLRQEIDASQFEPGEHLVLSIESRMPTPTLADQSLRVIVTAVLGVERVYQWSVSAADMTPESQRFVMRFTLPGGPFPAGSLLRFEFLNEVERGPAQPMYWSRPMLNIGDEPAPWTPVVKPSAAALAFRDSDPHTVSAPAAQGSRAARFR